MPSHTFSADGQSAWVEFKGGYGVFQVPGNATMGGGTVKMQMKANESDADATASDLSGVSLTAAGTKGFGPLSRCYVWFDLSGSTSPSIVATWEYAPVVVDQQKTLRLQSD